MLFSFKTECILTFFFTLNLLSNHAFSLLTNLENSVKSNDMKSSIFFAPGFDEFHIIKYLFLEFWFY